MIIPAGAVITSFVDFLVSFLILVGMMAWYRLLARLADPHAALAHGLAFLAAVGPGLWITALNVKYRDFRYVIPFLVQFGLYVSPVAYSSTVIRERFGDVVFTVYSLNPMVAVIDGFRWAILRGEVAIYWPGFCLLAGNDFRLPLARHPLLPQDREDVCRHNIAESREQRAESREQRAESGEERAKTAGREQKSRERESREQRAESRREVEAESREQRAESREQRAESRELRTLRS